MSDHVVVAVDAGGGDYGSAPVLEGVAQALAEDKDIEIILVGPAEVVEPFAAAHERVIAQPASEIIGMDEHPANAVRTKKDSSIVVGCRMIKEGRAQGFFSPGSTGACLVAATLIVGRIKGVARPAMCTLIPSPVKLVCMCDVGANADCKPEYLLQFGQMARAYMEKVIGVDNPKAALLNIGEEDTKGSQFALETFDLLKENMPNFIGNREGTEVLGGEADIYIADGFTGNVCIKTIEGVANTLFSSLKDIIGASVVTKLGGLTLKSGLKDLKWAVNPDRYGGAPILGVKGEVLVGHGSSGALAVKNGIHTTAKAIRKDLSGVIAKTVNPTTDSE